MKHNLKFLGSKVLFGAAAFSLAFMLQGCKKEPDVVFEPMSTTSTTTPPIEPILPDEVIYGRTTTSTTTAKLDDSCDGVNCNVYGCGRDPSLTPGRPKGFVGKPDCCCPAAATVTPATAPPVQQCDGVNCTVSGCGHYPALTPGKSPVLGQPECCCPLVPIKQCSGADCNVFVCGDTPQKYANGKTHWAADPSCCCPVTTPSFHNRIRDLLKDKTIKTTNAPRRVRFADEFKKNKKEKKHRKVAIAA